MKRPLMAMPLVALLVLVAAGCGKEDKGKGEDPATQKITSINDILSARDRNSLVGKRVEISDAVVQRIAGNYIFWAGDRGSSIPVARKDKYEGRWRGPVQPGHAVRISGTVRLTAPVEAANWMWDTINDREKREVENVGIYILADDVLKIR